LREILSELVGRVGPTELAEILLDRLLILGGWQGLLQALEILWHHDSLQEVALAGLAIALVLHLAGWCVAHYAGVNQQLGCRNTLGW
jgi:hypothetical protein